MIKRLSFWLRCLGDWLVRASYRIVGDDPDCIFCGDNDWGTYSCDRCIIDPLDYAPEEDEEEYRPMATNSYEEIYGMPEEKEAPFTPEQVEKVIKDYLVEGVEHDD